MRVFAAVLLSIGLAASPLLAGGAGETGKEETPATVSSPSAAPEKVKEVAVKPEPSAIESEMQELRSLVEEQRAELEEQRAALKAAERKMESLEERLRAPAPEPATPATAAVAAVQPASSAAIEPVAAGAAAITAAVKANPNPGASPNPTPQEEQASPLQFKIGTAYITPVGFMDFTGVWANHDRGSGIGTNFAGITYGTTAFQNNLSELRFSMQNSRIGFRVDALVKGAHVIGYMESDYLGNNAGSVAVSSNSNTLRSRLYWVDLRKGAWELLGGQTWSLATPNRRGVSPLPGDVFFSNDIDVNYQLGMVWGRIPEFRLAYHFPNDKAAFAIALDQNEQYIGGANGASSPTLPAAFASAAYLTGGTAEVNNGGNTLTTPARAPDVIAKIVVDPSARFHGEIGGIARFFQIYNPNTNLTHTAEGGGGFVNLDFGVTKQFRLLTHDYWSDGGGRYIFGQAPDFVLGTDLSPSLIHASSTVDGFEYTVRTSLLYGYYGAVYINRNIRGDLNGCYIGWGFGASPAGSGPGCTAPQSGQNRAIQEGTLGFNQTIWRDAKYGAINFMGQYSYLTRNPWVVTGTNPRNAHLSMAFLNLRYTLPGSAPTLGK